MYIQDEDDNTLSILDSEPGEDETAPDYYIINDEDVYAVITLYSVDDEDELTAVWTVTDTDLDVITDTGLYICGFDSNLGQDPSI